ncbi:unnamed protein product [Clavelina lepadiformis]|uniref:Uncharacterized protein n=1 Tax=Clavelina lepadiformis TaxID=159417 RepID=A0ABP0GWE6_CLALP
MKDIYGAYLLFEPSRSSWVLELEWSRSGLRSGQLVLNGKKRNLFHSLSRNHNFPSAYISYITVFFSRAFSTYLPQRYVRPSTREDPRIHKSMRLKTSDAVSQTRNLGFIYQTRPAQKQEHRVLPTPKLRLALLSLTLI